MNDKIDIELAEDEDLARAKAWWKENGTSIIGGIAIGTAMVVGYNFWQTYQNDKADELAQLYEVYTQSPQSTEALAAVVEASDGSVYASMARFSAAKTALEASDYAQAEQLLNGVISAESNGLDSVAVVRLGLVYLAQNKADEAISLMDKYSDSNAPLMQARVLEVKADAYLLKDDIDKAKELFTESIASYTEAGQLAPLVEIKLNNL